MHLKRGMKIGRAQMIKLFAKWAKWEVANGKSLVLFVYMLVNHKIL